MAQVIANSGHNDMIHDADLDYYGSRLATCSSDKTIKIFEVDGDTYRLTKTLKGHKGAVWWVSWAHHKYGKILASASSDGKVFIWSEQNGHWQHVPVLELHSASVNLISWAPHNAGCILACARSDGNVSVLDYHASAHQILPAHDLAVNAVSWDPSIATTSTTSPTRRFVTGGNDCLVKAWEWSPETNAYTCISQLSGHSDWVRDVAWAPAVLPKAYIASASQDKTVKIWTSTNPSRGDWQQTTLNFDSVALRAGWSWNGSILGVSTGDNTVSLWKEKVTGGWECIKTIQE